MGEIYATEEKGTTSERREEGKCGSTHRPQSVGDARPQSKITWYQQGSTDRKDCPEWGGGGNFGGILRQLRESKAAHLEYVRAHIERLKSRLAEAQMTENSLLEEIEEIDNQIKA